MSPHLHTHQTLRWEEGRRFYIPDDRISPEVPLGILLTHGALAQRKTEELVLSMRSPGQDEQLALGFLFTEGIIAHRDQVVQIKHIGENQLEVQLKAGLVFNRGEHKHYSFSNSACGLCNKTGLEQLEHTTCYFPQPAAPKVSPQLFKQLATALQKEQSLFKQTGGMHAAALFDSKASLLMLCEDIGRHNAMDKLVGTALGNGLFPWRNHIVFMTSRLSYELVLKAAMVGTPILAAMGAASSLAIEMAEQSGITLVGFVRKDRFNVYTYPERIDF